jgi:hypothetical protein
VRGGEDPAAGAEGLPLCYLHVPAGKNRGPFWIWIPAYTADAIDAWRAERPGGQRPLLDAKDREEVEYLFTVRERRVGVSFFNASLIPTLCRKAGIDQHDAKGRLTGHRGRSTRLTLLLRQGVSLEDLAAYAGHVNTDTIRRYANPHPLQLHRTIKAADDLSRIIEGVVDLEAAARGLPALRWFIGYDADGAPMYCANQAYQTCPHRLDCVKCGMFIGGTKARLLHAGEHTLPVQSTTPLTPLERCVLRDDQAGMDAERAKLAAVPPPDPSSLTVVFNPSGLTDAQLARVAAEGTPEALATLREVQTACEQALADSGRDRTNRNARVGALRKRLASVTDLLAACMEQIAAKRPGVAEGSE